jgi:hypothetical protein
MRRLDNLWPPRNKEYQADAVTTLLRTWQHSPNWLGFETVLVSHVLAMNGTKRDGPAGAGMDLVESLSRYQTTPNGLIVVAPHGGGIEPHTDEQAMQVYDQLVAVGKGVSARCCKG